MKDVSWVIMCIVALGIAAYLAVNDHLFIPALLVIGAFSLAYHILDRGESREKHEAE